MATSCKSCSICQDIMKQLQQHISTGHVLSGAEGVIGNVILNLLTLMIPENTNIELKQLNQTVPVISKPPDKQIPVIQDRDNSIANVDSSRSGMASFTNEFTTSNISNRLPVQSELQVVSSILPLSSETKMKEDHHSNLSQPSKNATLQQISNLLEFPYMLQQNNELQNESGIVNSLVNADGTLTPIGISLLLSNQTNRVNVTGKSDLDDVADILVNKMPIPSLKNLESSNFQQLSTFYLQQLALSQLQALTSSVTTSVDNSTPTSQSVSGDYAFSKDENIVSFNQSKSNTQFTSSDHTGSLQQLLERHKQISGLIEAMNSKPKNEATFSKQESSQAAKLLEDATNALNAASTSTSMLIPKLPPLPQHLRNVAPASTFSKQKIGILTESSGRKTQVPVLLASNDPSLLGQVHSPKDDNEYATADENVHFSREKRDDPTLTLNNLQNLIIETAKRIQVQEIPTTKGIGSHKPDVRVAVTPSLSEKNPLTSLQGIIINATKVKDDIGTSSKADTSENGSSALRTYSSMAIPEISGFNSSLEEAGNIGNQDQQDPKLLYKCEQCGVTFSVLSTLTAHIKGSHSEKVEFCNYCQVSFSSHEEYYAHLASHRGEENIYSCQFCSKIFTSNGDFKKHVIKHTQKRPYSCGHCQKSFRDPGSLAKHERIHTGEQPFICEICNRGFAEKSSLRKHSRVHSGEKPYKCQLCDKSFSISGNLQRHMLIHTGKRPFKCTFCSKAFNNPSHLRRHIKNLHAKAEGKQAEGSNLVVPRSTNVDDDLKDDESME